MKASKCVQSLKKTIKDLAKPSLPEPFFNGSAELNPKGSIGKIQNPNGSGREGFAKFFIVFLRLWTHLEAFIFLQNLF